jgi:hypothetical protein
MKWRMERRGDSLPMVSGSREAHPTVQCAGKMMCHLLSGRANNFIFGGDCSRLFV